MIVVKFHFDLICPWCLIGKRHLRSALALLRERHPEVATVVEWHSHPLLPATPIAGIPYQAFYEQRLGGAAAVAARRQQVHDAARHAGVEFAFERIERMPNTLAAHRLIDCAGACGSPQQVDDLIDRLFTAYFMDGRDIGDSAVLDAIAGAAGLAPDDLAACLATPERLRAFSTRLAAPTDVTVSGVPLFVFNERVAVSGAQSPQSLLAAMEQALPATRLRAPL